MRSMGKNKQDDKKLPKFKGADRLKLMLTKEPKTSDKPPQNSKINHETIKRKIKDLNPAPLLNLQLLLQPNLRKIKTKKLFQLSLVLPCLAE